MWLWLWWLEEDELLLLNASGWTVRRRRPPVGFEGVLYSCSHSMLIRFDSFCFVSFRIKVQ